MKVIFNIDKYIDKVNEGGLTNKDKRKIIQYLEIGKDVEIKEVNLGVGADWIVILVIINSIVNVFLVGDKVDKGIDGWIKLAKRVRGLFRTKQAVYIDRDGASLLALELIAAQERINQLEKISEQEIYLNDLSSSLPDRNALEFTARPYAYYIQAFLVNDEKIYVIGIRSDGIVNEIKCFENNSLHGLKELKKDM